MNILICGTKEKSIGKYLGKELIEYGHTVWLYSRSAIPFDNKNLHIRMADISDIHQTRSLLDEIGGVDMVIMSADTGSVFGDFSSFSSEEINNFINTKITASIFLIQELIKRNLQTKVVFLAGKLEQKDKTYFLYSIANNALLALVNEINTHYQKVKCYYLETPLISPSTIGDNYLNNFSPTGRGYAPSVLLEPILKIISDDSKLGFIKFSGETL
jgi:NADP-dependent 3-hydroxy acid dehydrogenase YdfG